MIAALHATDFPLQAILRVQPERTEEPLVVVRGERLGGGAEVACATEVARAHGVRDGMTVAQARALHPGLVVLLRDAVLEASARDALTDVATSFSPRIEVGHGDALGWAYIDVSGLDRLIGEPRHVGIGLQRAAEQVGLTTVVGIARSKTLARLAALDSDGCAVVPPDDEAAHTFLAAKPLDVLEPSPALGKALHRFGLRSVGELLDLSVDEVADRLGPEGVKLCRRARGEEERGGLRPDKPPSRFNERIALDYAIASLEPLSFVLRGALDRLVQRLSLRGFLAGDLVLTLETEGAGRHVCNVKCGAPSRDVRALLALCRLVLSKKPPSEGVIAVDVQAAPEAPRPRQLSFFEPVGPAPDKLAVTVARLKALCGTDRVGAPSPSDSFRDDAFEVAPLGGDTDAGERPEAPPVALRRYRPPKPVDVIWKQGRPVRLEGGDVGGRVVGWNGPYRRSEGWWVGEREPDAVHGDIDVFDLQTHDGIAYRVAYDRACRRWLMQGWYD